MAKQPTEPPAAETTGWEPLVVGFLCNWCSYAGADLAGSSRMSYPANVRVIRVPCSGRVDPQFVMKCFRQGFDGVLVAGCHVGDCHYAKGNYYTRRRMPVATELLNGLGIEPERIRFAWVSASEGAEFVDLVRDFTQQLKQLGPLSLSRPLPACLAGDAV